MAIPIPDDVPASTYDHVSPKLFRTDPAEAARQMREKGRAISERDTRNAALAGVTHYVWRTRDDSDVCERCASQNGKRFAWKKPPSGGHPGTCEDCPSGWCRCYAESVLPTA